MPSLAQVTIIGHVGRDPEVKQVKGTDVAELSVAVSHGRRDDPQATTDWFRVSAWGLLAKRAQEVCHKGGLVYVAGSLKTRTYQGRDGQTRIGLDVRATELLALSKNEVQQVAAQPAPKPAQAQAQVQVQAPLEEPWHDDDIPF